MPTQSSVSQAFTQDMSDWNKESAIVEDQVQKFLLRKDAKPQNTQRVNKSSSPRKSIITVPQKIG